MGQSFSACAHNKAVHHFNSIRINRQCSNHDFLRVYLMCLNERHLLIFTVCDSLYVFWMDKSRPQLVTKILRSIHYIIWLLSSLSELWFHGFHEQTAIIRCVMRLKHHLASHSTRLLILSVSAQKIYNPSNTLAAGWLFD